MEEAYGGDAGRLQQHQPPDQPLAHPSVPVVGVVSMNDLGKAPGSPAANIPTSGSLPAAAPWAAQAGPAVGAGNHSIQPTSSVPTPALGSGQSTAWRSAAAAADPAAPPAARPSFALGAPAPWEQQQRAWWQKQPEQQAAYSSHSSLGGSTAKAGLKVLGGAVSGPSATPRLTAPQPMAGDGLHSLPALPEGPSTLGVHPPAGTPASQSSPAPPLHPAFMLAGAAGSRPAPVAAAVTAGHEGRLLPFQGAAPDAFSLEAAVAALAAPAAAAAEAHELDAIGHYKVPAAAAGAVQSDWMGAARSKEGLGAAAAATGIEAAIGATAAPVARKGSLITAESMLDSEGDDMEEVEQGCVAVKEEERPAAPASAAGSGSDKSNQEGGFPAAVGRMGAGGFAAGLNQQAGQSGRSGVPGGNAPQPMPRPALPSIRTLRGLLDDVGSWPGAATLAAAPVGSHASPFSHFSAPVMAAAEPQGSGSLSLMAAAAGNAEGMEIEGEEKWPAAGPAAATAAAGCGSDGWEDTEMESELEAGATELVEAAAADSDGEEGPAVGAAAAAAAAAAGQGSGSGAGGPKPKLPNGVTQKCSGRFGAFITVGRSSNRWLLGTYPSLESAIKAHDYGVVYINHATTGLGPAKGATYHPLEEYTADAALMQELRALRGWDDLKLFLKERLGGSTRIRKAEASLAAARGGYERLQPRSLPGAAAAAGSGGSREGRRVQQAAKAPCTLPDADNHNLHQGLGPWWESGDGGYSRRCSQSTLSTGAVLKRLQLTTSEMLLCEASGACRSWPATVYTTPSRDRNILQGSGMREAIRELHIGIGDTITLRPAPAREGLSAVYISASHCSPASAPPASAAVRAAPGVAAGTSPGAATPYGLMGGVTNGGGSGMQPHSKSAAAAAGASRPTVHTQQQAQAQEQQGQLGAWRENEDGSYSKECSRSNISKAYLSVNDAMVKRLKLTSAGVVLVEASGSHRSWVTEVYTGPQKDRFLLQGAGMREAIRGLQLAEGDTITLRPAPAREGKSAAYISVQHCGQAQALQSAGAAEGALPRQSSRNRSSGRCGSGVPSYKEDDSEAESEEEAEGEEEAESEEEPGGSRQEASLQSHIAKPAKCRQWSILGDGVFGYRVSSAAISKGRLSVPGSVNQVWGVEGLQVDLVHTSPTGQRRAWRVHNHHYAGMNPTALNIEAGFADVISGLGLKEGQTVELRLATAAEQPDQQVPALHIQLAGRRQAQQQHSGAQATGSGGRAAAAGYAFPAGGKPPGQAGGGGSAHAGPKRVQHSAGMPPAGATAATGPAGAAPPAQVQPSRPPGPSLLRKLLSSTRPASPGAGAAAGGAPAAVAQPGGFKASALGPRGASTGSGVSDAAGSSAAAVGMLGWESEAGGGFSREVHKEMLSTRSRITLPVPVAKSLGLLGAYKVWVVHPPTSWRWELNVAHHLSSSDTHQAKEVRLTVGVSGMGQDLNLQLGQRVRLSRHAAVDGKPAFAIEVVGGGRSGGRSGGDSPGQQALSVMASGTARGGQQPMAGKCKSQGGRSPQPPATKRANVQQQQEQQQQEQQAAAAAPAPLLGQSTGVASAPPFQPLPASAACHAAPAAAGMPGAMRAGLAGAGQQSAQPGPAAAGAGADAAAAGGAAATAPGATTAAVGQGGPAGAPVPLGSYKMFVALRPVVNGSRAAGAGAFLRMFLTRCDHPTQRAHYEHLMQLHQEGQVGEIVEWVDGTVQDFARGR